MTDQTMSNRVRERAKLVVRRALHRVDLEVSRGAYPNRLARTLDARGLDTILDVGANVGQFASLVRGVGFSGRIVSCEPLAGAFSELERRAGKDADWTPVRVAVGREPGTTSINVSANSYSSSILPMTEAHRTSAPGSGYVSTEEVPVTTVRDLVVDQSITPGRTLLKIDTQGYEEAVLDGAGPLLGEFGAVQLELSLVELYEGQVLFDDLYDRVRRSGFRIHILEPGFSDAQGRLMQVDGLFVRAADDTSGDKSD